jgi:ankyrin repeat protein
VGNPTGRSPHIRPRTRWLAPLLAVVLGVPWAMAQEGALFLAITTLNRATFDAALAAGADPNARDSFQQTPLMYSVRADQLALTRDLIDAGADVNARTLSGWTPLHYAAYDAVRTEIIELLLDAYANPTLRNADGANPADLAAAQGNADFAEALATFEARTRERLFEAIVALDSPLFQAALRAGADVNGRDAFGQSPLMYSVAANQLGMTRRLLAEGARVNDASAAGWTALHYAARANISAQLSEALLAAGADPELRSGDGETPSMVATREGNGAAEAALAAHSDATPTAARPPDTRTGTGVPARNTDDCWLAIGDDGSRPVVITGGEQGLRAYWSTAMTEMFGAPAQPSGPHHYYSVDSLRKTVVIAEIPIPTRCAGGRAIVDVAQVTVCATQFSDEVLLLREGDANARTVRVDLTLRDQTNARIHVTLPWGTNPGSSTLCAVTRGL